MVLKFKTFLRLFKKKKFIALFLVILLIVYFIVQRTTKAPEIKTAAAQLQDIKSTVISSGSVRAKDSASLTFSTAGKIAWIGVKEGATVYKGQAIASLDREKFEITLRQAQQEVVATDAALQKVYDGLPKDKVESFTDKVNRTAAEANKNQAFDALKEAERQLRNSTIYSPIAGTITEINVITGQEVQITTKIGEVADLNSKKFVSEVDESDIGKIADSQKALITLDAFPNEVFETEIEQIAQHSTTTSTGATAFEVKFILNEEPGIRIGMNGEAEIIIEEKTGALTVPTEALLDEKYLYLKTPTGFEKREVEIGIESDFAAEITANINKGDEVVISGSEFIGTKNWLQKLLSGN